ncbi:MAG: dCTP deaminase [Hyphomicrobiaceae bacterium]|nr:MAG: dCTP deaminase [Hyphomicrobiaceae bacterium]
MLTGPEIIREIESGNITISPLIGDVNPNSVNLCLADELYEVKGRGYCYDITRPMSLDDVFRHDISDGGGIVLEPGKLYLGSTIEIAGSSKYVPVINGRSSVGRYGVSVHVTAGFGDVGFCSHWTLEITSVLHVRVYSGLQICQISFHRPEGELQQYAGKYAQQTGPVLSKGIKFGNQGFKWFQKEEISVQAGGEASIAPGR